MNITFDGGNFAIPIKPDESMVASSNQVCIVIDDMESKKIIQTIYSCVNPDGTIYGEHCRVCLYQKTVYKGDEKHNLYQTICGKFIDGYLSGKGKIAKRNSNRASTIGNITYEGTWTNGLMDGRIKISQDHFIFIGFWDKGEFNSKKQVTLSWPRKKNSYIGFIDQNYIINGKGRFKTKIYQKLEGYFHDSMIYDIDASYIDINGIEYKGAMLNDNRNGYGTLCKYNEICKCCGKLYREKYNIKTDTEEQRRKIKNSSTKSGYWFHNKLIIKSDTKRKCCHKKCPHEPTICCMTCQKVYCTECFHTTHKTFKMKSHEFFYLDPKYYLTLDNYDMENHKYTLEQLEKVKVKVKEQKSITKKSPIIKTVSKGKPKKESQGKRKRKRKSKITFTVDHIAKDKDAPKLSKVNAKEIERISHNISSNHDELQHEDDLIAKYKQIRKDYQKLKECINESDLDDTRLKLMESKIERCAPIVEQLENFSKIDAESDFTCLLEEEKKLNGGKNFVFKNS